MHRLVTVATLIVLAGCGTPPAASETSASLEPIQAEAREGGFTITLRAEAARVRSGDEISVTATLGHDRDGDVTLWGSGSGLVFFSVTRLDDGLTSGPPVHTDDCVPHVLPVGGPATVPFVKTGGFSPDDPNAEFLEIYFADPALSLPAGTWRIEATTAANLGEGCAGEPLELSASVDVTVID